MSMNLLTHSLLLLIFFHRPSYPLKGQDWAQDRGCVIVTDCNCTRSGRPLASRLICRAAGSEGWNRQTADSSLPFPQSEDTKRGTQHGFVLLFSYPFYLVKIVARRWQTDSTWCYKSMMCGRWQHTALPLLQYGQILNLLWKNCFQQTYHFYVSLLVFLLQQLWNKKIGTCLSLSL